MNKEASEVKQNNKEIFKELDHRVGMIELSMNNEVQHLKETNFMLEINVSKAEQDNREKNESKIEEQRVEIGRVKISISERKELILMEFRGDNINPIVFLNMGQEFCNYTVILVRVDGLIGHT